MEQKQLLNEEFKSLGFIHLKSPLSEYEEAFNQLKIITYNHFISNSDKDALMAGTIMSIQEKKSSKGTPYAIIKFSDKNSEFELFLFSDMLVNNQKN